MQEGGIMVTKIKDAARWIVQEHADKKQFTNLPESFGIKKLSPPPQPSLDSVLFSCDACSFIDYLTSVPAAAIILRPPVTSNRL